MGYTIAQKIIKNHLLFNTYPIWIAAAEANLLEFHSPPMKFQHFSYSLALPPAAAKIQAAGQCHKTAVYGFGQPAYSYVAFHDPYDDNAENQVDEQGK